MSEDIKDTANPELVLPPAAETPVLEIVYSELSENIETPEHVELEVPSPYGPPIDLKPVEPTSAEEFKLVVGSVDITEEQKAIAEELNLQFVINNRVMEYPSVSEQLSALYEARQGNDKPIKEIDAKIKAVKEKYPKPE